MLFDKYDARGNQPHFIIKLSSSAPDYRTRAIIARFRSETALEYKPRILGLKNKEFLFLVHKSVVQTAPQYKNGVKNIQTAGYNGARTVYIPSRNECNIKFENPLDNTLQIYM